MTTPFESFADDLGDPNPDIRARLLADAAERTSVGSSAGRVEQASTLATRADGLIQGFHPTPVAFVAPGNEPSLAVRVPPSLSGRFEVKTSLANSFIPSKHTVG